MIQQIKARITYPEPLRGGCGVYNEVVFKSDFLTSTHVYNNIPGPIYGTDIYTSDSDLLKGNIFDIHLLIFNINHNNKFNIALIF